MLTSIYKRTSSPAIRKNFVKIKTFFFVTLIAVLFTTCASNPVTAPYSDIAGHQYQKNINALYARGFLDETAEFEPNRAITRSESAVLLQRVFALAPIATVTYPEYPNLRREKVYAGNLGVVTETFTVPTALDSAGISAGPSIEALINSEVIPYDEVKGDNWSFHPGDSVTEKVFARWVARALYGPEQDIDHLQKAVDAKLIDADVAAGGDTLTRGKAAYIINKVSANLKVVTVFATADIHGHLDPYKPSGSNVNVGALARMGAIVNAHRATHPNTLLIDAGDSPYNTNIANLFQGKSTVDTMNAMKYDATVLGNHDFDYSFQNLGELAHRADYAFLSLNTYNKDGTFPGFLKEYIVKKVDGITIGIVGMTDDQSKATTHFSNTMDIEFKPDIATSRAVVDKLISKEKPNIIIALSHLHGKNIILPDTIPEIDVEIGGGMDVMGQPIIKGTTWVVNPGKHAECINQMSLNVIGGKLVGVVFNQIILNEKMPEDPAVKTVVDSYIAQMDSALKEVIGSTQVDLDGERSTVRFTESNLGNLITDSQIAYFQADVAIQNGGGIRLSVPAGPITIGDVFGILPFDNKMLVLEMTGQTLWECLENGLVNHGTGDGRFPQVGGIKFTADDSKPVGQRLVSVSHADGSPLSLTRKYKVVVNDFMAGGGDGYNMIKVIGAADPNAPFVTNVTKLVETTLLQRQILEDYLKRNPNVSPKLEGRITFK
jgi:2',3'-cyclic-nucleotide 2'-phosphodiesterase (5'-nucleotidase family)